MIQHGQSYKTLYAHMSKYGRGIRNGVRVKQGQIIGYVGSSGLATGPHLHYEFYLNGAVRNPVRVNLPKAKAIAKTELANFKIQTQSIVATLQDYQKNIQVASNAQ
jgi:murein DD-endopeptidase MepM/ murein hydrolase activator NlpD